MDAYSSLVFDIYQERAEESDSTSGAALHCTAVYESHFSRTANDLHPSPHVYTLPYTSVSTGYLSNNYSINCTLSDQDYKLWDFFFSRLLPWDANVATYRFMGGDKCMLPFIKNVELKTSNGYIKSS